MISKTEIIIVVVNIRLEKYVKDGAYLRLHFDLVKIMFVLKGQG
jgi:hypothetical protein